MALRKTPPAPRQARLTADQMRAAIPRLERRIKDLEDFDPDTLQERSDPRISALDTKVLNTITDVFGPETIEFNQFQPSGLDGAGYSFVRRYR